MNKKRAKKQKNLLNQMQKQGLFEKAVVAQFLINNDEKINHWDLQKIEDSDRRKIDIIAVKGDLHLPIQVTSLVPELIDDFRNPEVFAAEWGFDDNFVRGYYDDLMLKGMKEEAFRYLFDHLNEESFLTLVEYPIKRKIERYEGLDISDLILLLDSSPLDSCPLFLCGKIKEDQFKFFWKYKFKEIWIVFKNNNLRIK